MVLTDNYASLYLFLYKYLFTSELKQIYFLSFSEDVNIQPDSYVLFLTYFRCRLFLMYFRRIVLLLGIM